MVRETFGIPRQDNLKLRDYPTLRHVVGFVQQGSARWSPGRGGASRDCDHDHGHDHGHGHGK